MGLTTGTWITKDQYNAWSDSSYGWEVRIIKGSSATAAAMAICLQTNDGSQSQSVGYQSLIITSEVPFTVKVKVSTLEEWQDYTPTLTTNIDNHTFYYIRIFGRQGTYGDYSFRDMSALTGWFTLPNDINSFLGPLPVVQNMIDRLGGPYVPPPHGEGVVQLVLKAEGQQLTFISANSGDTKTEFVDSSITIDFTEE